MNTVKFERTEEYTLTENQIKLLMPYMYKNIPNAVYIKISDTQAIGFKNGVIFHADVTPGNHNTHCKLVELDILVKS